VAVASKALVDKYAATFGNRMWRLHNLYWITDEEGEEVLFRPNEDQANFLGNRWHFNCILKARRLGFSTVIQIDGLDDCIFNSNIEFGIIAQSLDDAKAIFRSKIKFAYDRLPQELREVVAATTDSANEIRFSNGSGVRVGTSLRGGTLQRLHVSEYGKISARYPEKAKEIKTGALNTVHAGQLIDIESTAEGIGGEFYDLCQRSEKLKTAGTHLTSLDPRFHFYPWWMKRSHRLPDRGVFIDQKLKVYFDKLESQGIGLDDEQKAWYAKKAEQMGDDMKREFPSTPKEPFEVAVEGAYYANEMARVRKEGRICRIPVETAVPVNTFWDLGRNDLNSIWLHQHTGKEDRFIGFYQSNGESLGHYVKWLKDWLPQGCSWGEHYLPHDAEVTDLSQLQNLSRQQVIEQLGLKHTRVVPRTPEIGTGIQQTRDAFASCWFDAEATAEGITCLDNYRKDWNEQLGTWRDYPRHDQYAHGADAFRQFGQGYSRTPRWGNASADVPEDDWVL
jgi:hypothetical protein